MKKTSTPKNLPAASAPTETLETALEEIARIYEELARRPVERDCQLRAECCHFRRTGLTPYLTLGEALYLARAVRASGKTRCEETTGGECPVWDAVKGRCRAYTGRPLGCRTHFCQAAGGPMARAEVIDLIRRLEAIDARLGGDGSRPLPSALADALEVWRARSGRGRSALVRKRPVA